MSDGARDVSPPEPPRRGEVALLRADLADLEAQARAGRSGAFLVTGTAVAALLIGLASGGFIFVMVMAVLLSVGAVFSWKSWLEQEDRIAEVKAVLAAAEDAPPDAPPEASPDGPPHAPPHGPPHGPPDGPPDGRPRGHGTGRSEGR